MEKVTGLTFAFVQRDLGTKSFYFFTYFLTTVHYPIPHGFRNDLGKILFHVISNRQLKSISIIRPDRTFLNQPGQNINPIPTEGGPFGPEQPITVWHFHSFMAGVTKIHDFVYFSICLVPVNLFWEKKL